MASASTSTAVNSCYEIFLNHRGPDTKKTFTSHLYHRLVLHGFRVFWDKEEMQVGDSLTSQIHEAIKAASLHVAIFSPGYAESKWCLEELVLMLESKEPIIPVFYGVHPTDVRQTQGDGVFAQALRNLQKKRRHDSSQPRYNSTAIENWRTALSTVAEISGLELDKFSGDEGELLDKVVDSVLKKMGKTRFDVAEHPTGLDEKIEDFEEKVLSVQREHTGKPQVIGIVGFGGIGKTTLVKELFNTKSSQYQKSCILFDVRENARKASLESLQKKLLKGLTQIDQNIESVSEGIQLLKTHLSSCDALVILDDVDHINQLDALLRPIRDVLHPHSLILITSRDKGVLKSSKVEESSIYKLTGLNTLHSEELFCLHAFSQRHPLPGFEDLVHSYLKACDGLPLSLKVFGAILYENDKSFWQDQLDRLEEILPEDIEKSLQISYNALQRDEKQIFLDVACFFIGKNRDTAIRIWDGSGWKGSLGFRSLHNKNLVEVDSENKIRMHDHLRDLGRDLAKNPELPRRIWRIEDFEDLLQQSSEIDVRGISIYWTKREHPSFARCRIRNLQLLDFDVGDSLEHPLEIIRNAIQSPNLIWFSDCNNYVDSNQSSPPSWIPLKKLRVLELRVLRLRTLWEEESESLELLASASTSTSTVVNSCYEIFLNHRGPDTKKTFTSHLYHRLVSQGFRVFWDKQEMQVGDTLSSQIHEAIKAASLHVAIFSPRYAESHWCLDELLLMVESGKPIIPVFHHVHPTELRATQGEGIYAQALRNLQKKRRHDSSQPRYNSTAIENWRTALSTVAEISGLELDEFNGDEGELLEKVVDSVLKKMGKPRLDVAEHPTGLDQKIEDFEKKVLFVQREHTGKPQVIGIVGSGGIGKTTLVKELFNRKSSQYQKSCILFDVRENARKASLESLQNKLLKGLTQIDQNIESVSEGIQLLKTRVSSCEALVILDDVDHIDQLDALLRPIRDVLHPHSLILITSRDKGVLRSSKVEESSIYRLTGLNRPQSQELFCLHAFSQGHPLPGFEDLVHRYLKACDGLPLSFVSLTGKKAPLQLRELIVRGSAITSLPHSFGNLTNLEHIQLSTFHLEILPDSFVNLPRLQHLELRGCDELKSITLRNLTRLKYLKLTSCFCLRSITLGTICTLEHVRLSGCQSIEVLPSQLARQQSLEVLHLQDLPKLRELPSDIGELKNLKHLRLERCERLESLPSQLARQQSLEVLHLEGLRDLSELPSDIGELKNLKHLHLEGCESLESLPDSLGRLNQLTNLTICFCSRLREVSFKMVEGERESICPNLQHLYIHRCNDLVEVGTLPDALTTLIVSACLQLRKIEWSSPLSKLQMLNIHCSKVEQLPSLETLVSLEELDTSRCERLRSIRGVAHLPKLRTINVSFCHDLEEVAGVEDLTSLEWIAFHGCYKLQLGERVKDLRRMPWM